MENTSTVTVKYENGKTAQGRVTTSRLANPEVKEKILHHYFGYDFTIVSIVPDEEPQVAASKIEAGAVIGGVEVLSVGEIRRFSDNKLVGLKYELTCIDGKKRLVHTTFREHNSKVEAGSYMMKGDYTHGPSRFVDLGNKKIFGKEFKAAAESSLLSAIKND